MTPNAIHTRLIDAAALAARPPGINSGSPESTPPRVVRTPILCDA